MAAFRQCIPAGPGTGGGRRRFPEGLPGRPARQPLGETKAPGGPKAPLGLCARCARPPPPSGARARAAERAA